MLMKDEIYSYSGKADCIQSTTFYSHVLTKNESLYIIQKASNFFSFMFTLHLPHITRARKSKSDRKPAQSQYGYGVIHKKVSL